MYTFIYTYKSNTICTNFDYECLGLTKFNLDKYVGTIIVL